VNELCEMSTDCLSISGPLNSCTAVLSFLNFYIVIMCLVAILLCAFSVILEPVLQMLYTAGKIE
jgi:hypothetical protein